MESLFDKITEDFIRRAITTFYSRAFEDPILAHFFVGKDIHHLTAMQIDFAIAILGGPQRYRGKPIPTAHKDLEIRQPHFGRRQVLMREVLLELGLAEELANQWLEREEQFKPVIVKGRNPPPSCKM